MDTQQTLMFIPILFVITTLILISVIASLIAKLIRVPLPIVLVLFGVLISQLPSIPREMDIFLKPAVAQEIIIYVLLPIIIFEEAYRFDIAKFADNWKIITLLALPGVLFSASVITLSLIFIGGLSPAISLLLGIILSATDPSATISIFKDTDAPKNLVTIVEGESLLNDASVIALNKVAILVLAADLTFKQMAIETLWQLLWLFTIGVVSGWIVGHLFLWLMRVLPDEPYIEISISFIVAIGCYIGVEHYLHASGIIALTTCGLLLAKNMPLPITQTSSLYLDSFWNYLADLSKAVIFIIVGLWFDIELIGSYWPITLLVVVSMLVARGILVYGVLPHVGHLSRHAYMLPSSYQHICLWGGLRGAVTLALALMIVTYSTVLDSMQREILLAVAMGTVTFTILIQGLTLEPLAKRLSLVNISLDDEITRKELILSALKKSKQAVSQLIQTPFSDSGASQEVVLLIQQHLDAERKGLKHLYDAQVGTEGMFRRLIMRGISIEIEYLYLLYDQGIIPSEIYQTQREQLDQQMDAVKHRYKQPSHTYTQPHWIKEQLLKWMHGRGHDVGFQYELAWSRLLSVEFTLSELEDELKDQEVDALLQEHVLSIWHAWQHQSNEFIRHMDNEYPILTARLQRKWLQHMLKTIHKTHLNKFVSQRVIHASDQEAITQELENMLIKTSKESD